MRDMNSKAPCAPKYGRVAHRRISCKSGMVGDARLATREPHSSQRNCARGASCHKSHESKNRMVGDARLELATPCSQSMCASQLRQSPILMKTISIRDCLCSPKVERAMGLEPTTVCLEGRDSSHWATPAWYIPSLLKAWAFYKNRAYCQTFLQEKTSRDQWEVFILKLIFSEPLELEPEVLVAELLKQVAGDMQHWLLP